MAIADFLDQTAPVSVPGDTGDITDPQQTVQTPQGLAAAMQPPPNLQQGDPGFVGPPQPINNGGLQLGGGLLLPGQSPPQQTYKPLVGEGNAPVIQAAPGSQMAQYAKDNPDQVMALPPQANAAPQGMYFAGRGQAAPVAGATKPTAGVTVPAVKDLVSPALEKSAQLTEQGSLNAAQGAAGIAGLQENMATQKAQDASDLAARAAKNYSYEQGEMDNIKALNDTAAAYKIDPNRYMKNASFLQKGLFVLAAGLNGAGMGFLKQSGPNQALQQMNTLVDRDIDAQKNEQESLRQKGIDATNLYNMNLKALGNEDAAVSATKAMSMEALADHVQAQTSMNQSQSVQDQGNLQANQIRVQAAELKQKAAQAAASAAAAKAQAQQKDIAETAKALVTSKQVGTPEEALEAARRMHGQGITQTPIQFAGPTQKNPGLQQAHDEAIQQVTGTPLTSTYHNPLTAFPTLAPQAAKDQQNETDREEAMIRAVMTSGRPGTQRYQAAKQIVENAYTTKGVPPAVARQRIAAFHQAFGGQVIGGPVQPDTEGTP